jgi:phage gpG-like protein
MIRTDFNATEAADAIRKAIAQLADMRPLFQDVTEYMIEATRQRFAKGVDPDGNAWRRRRNRRSIATSAWDTASCHAR